jgi:uncharacterized RDD family membrane protein YckC
MTQTPAGWYADPAAPPGAVPFQRYWDGQSWTEHLAAPAYPQAMPALPKTTPDGQRLAGWWSRVLASLLDSLISLPIVLMLSIPLWGRVISVFRDFFDEMDRAQREGAPMPSSFDVQEKLLVPSLLFGLLFIGFSLAYTFVFLRWKQATPGKLIVGLRVRRRDVPGPLPYGTIGLRWIGQNGASVVGLIPYAGSVLGLYPLLDSLWPLWDDKNQALHDKLAGTNVVVHDRTK